MASVLDSSLEDTLLPIVDDLRTDLLPAFGIRQYTVKVVKRTYLSEERGDGPFTIQETTLTPIPRVEIQEPNAGLRYDLRPQGREEDGQVKVSEISLVNYQEDDLTGGLNIPPNVDYYWALEDGHGQGIRRREYVLMGPPFADREKTLGWVVMLRRAEAT